VSGAPRTRVAIGLIAKAPLAGAVKTRLCPPLSLAGAAALAAGLLLDAHDAARRTGHDVWCVYAGPVGPLRRLLPCGTHLLAQDGDDLAARLAGAQRDLHGHDHAYDRVLLVGADCPTVDTALLRTAIASLDDADLVLGPAADGGYTLIGSTRPIPAFFAGVRMGTAAALRDTLAAAAAADLRVAEVEQRHDLDTIGDLRAALDAGQLAGAPRTRRAAARLLAPHPGDRG
jgi:uncharacterized protein